MITGLAASQLQAEVVVQSRVYESNEVVSEWAAYDLETQGTVIVEDGADVRFSAGQRITLKPGFSVEAGGFFQARVSAFPSYDPGGYYGATSPTLTVLSGDEQSGAVNSFNALPFDIAVFDGGASAPLVNAPVMLVVEQGGGGLSTDNSVSAQTSGILRLLTDSEGTVQAYYKHGSVPSVTSYIKVVAGDQVAQIETYSIEASPGPSVPAGLSAGSLTPTGFTLQWEPSSGGVGTISYDVYQDTVLIGSSGSITYAVTNLSPSTAYVFTVKARDAEDNVSAASGVLNVTTPAVPDISPPSIPLDLAASNVTTSGATLTWSASTDNVAVVGYEVSQNGVLLDATVNPSYQATGLAQATLYQFRIRAKDAAGNLSGLSQSLAVLTSSGSGDAYLVDFDGDGMPDGWENENGLDPLDAADASDIQGGLTNWQIYQQWLDAGGDPANTAPVGLLVYTP